MKLLFSKYSVVFFLCVVVVRIQAQTELSLSGEWVVAIDSSDKASATVPSADQFIQKVKLPGTLDDAGVGYKPEVVTDFMNKDIMRNLWRKKRFVGTAWYKREIQIPRGFDNKKLKLLLERVIWKTTVWVDNKKAGTAENLSTPQLFELPPLSPGKHTIVLAIDNRQQYQIGDATHAYTDGTQIIWNGVIGKMEIQAKEQSITQVNITPDVAGRKVNLMIMLDDVEISMDNRLKVAIYFKGKKIADKDIATDQKNTHLALPIPQPQLWDEFNPNLYTASVQLLRRNKVSDHYQARFGMRQVTNERSLLQINNNRIFLRGTLECNIFPLTGHPPMDKSGWIKVMTAAKSYGLNHLRFHSWCPPEAAFAVADSLGIYLQIELPLWATIRKNPDSTQEFLKKEAALILNSYGNHASFCFFSMGNELEGNFSWLNDLVKELKSQDGRRLYATTSFSFGQKSWPQPQDQFYVTQWTTKGWVRGQGIFNDRPPGFNSDYRRSIDSIPVPIISHEIGQYSVYPNMEEIKKYTGVLKPLNFIAVKKDLERKGMLSLADSYVKASGKLAASLYKEEIERALKTPGMSGFQLLDLHDFPGQSTALVGLLDAFWDSKGIITAKEFSKFCGPVIPLMRFEKAVYSGSERFSGTVEIANFSNAILKNANVQWTISDASGKTLTNGEWKPGNIPIGSNNKIGEIGYSLENIKTAKKLTIKVGIENTNYSNEWPVWIYPLLPELNKPNVHFTTSPKEALALVAKGGNVILNPDTAIIKGVAGRYTTVFWSPVHFPNQPGSMGLLIDSACKAFTHFPTETHSNWHWWDLVMRSKSMIIDSLTQKITPTVRVIDNFFKNRNMASLIEVKAGTGKLIICSMDIHTDLHKRPAAAQLRYSLIAYAASEAFNPVSELTYQEISSLFHMQ